MRHRDVQYLAAIGIQFLRTALRAIQLIKTHVSRTTIASGVCAPEVRPFETFRMKKMSRYQAMIVRTLETLVQRRQIDLRCIEQHQPVVGR